MRRLSILALFVNALLCATPLLAQPAISAVVNGASFGNLVSPGSLISIFGTRLAQSQVTATSVPLPRSLGGTTVTVGSLEAPLYFVSASQINAQVPFEISGSSAPVVVTTTDGRNAAFPMNMVPASPGIFTRTSDGRGPALVFDANFQPAGALSLGDTAVFYATGLGPTNPPATTGSGGAVTEPLNRAVNVPEVFVGGVRARVTYAGLAPGFVGVYQINIEVPRAPRTSSLLVASLGMTSNVASVGLRANVTNVTGSIEPIYPTGSTTATASLVPQVGKYRARLDILPDATPFTIVLSTAAGTAVVIEFDPAERTFLGTLTVPTLAARNGDFSGFSRPVFDLLTCTAAPGGSVTCFPFPGNIIPLARLDPLWLRSLETVPLPNTPGLQVTASFLLGARSLSSSFAVDEENNSQLSTFGNFLEIRYEPSLRRRVTTFSLFIDSRLISSIGVEFNTP